MFVDQATDPSVFNHFNKWPCVIFASLLHDKEVKVKFRIPADGRLIVVVRCFLHHVDFILVCRPSVLMQRLTSLQASLTHTSPVGWGIFTITNREWHSCNADMIWGKGRIFCGLSKHAFSLPPCCRSGGQTVAATLLFQEARTYFVVVKFND